jgi:hypothetical protein
MFAQSIRGKITDGNKEAVAGATVIAEGTNVASITDALGNYTLNNLKPGKYKIKVSLLGYRTIFKVVELGMQNASFNFNLAEENLHGAIPCFCYGHSSTCQSSDNYFQYNFSLL